MTDQAQRYIDSRTTFRAKARERFHQDDNAAKTIAIASELVARLTFFLDGRDLGRLAHGRYFGDLVVSYCRTHFIIADLVQDGELIEAVALLRKQIELIARLWELAEATDQGKLLGKTPNLRHLKSKLKRFYDEYSAIAHSSRPEPLSLLGRRDQCDASWTLLYPEFSRNAYVACNHLGIAALDFSLAFETILGSAFAAEDQPEIRVAVASLTTILSEDPL